jgi:hypothetical protein
MDKRDIDELKKELSRVNELRHEFWTKYRKARNHFLSEFPAEQYKNDPDWLELHDLMADMYKSCIYEDMRRQNVAPFRDRPGKSKERIASGLYQNVTTRSKFQAVCRKM